MQSISLLLFAKGDSCKVMGQSSTHKPLSKDLGTKGSKTLKGISAREAVRFARLLHRNSVFQCFKGGRKEQFENFSFVVMHMEKCKYFLV